MYYLGIDIGGTLTKTGLYTKEGKEIAVAEKGSDALTPHPGWVERDMDDFWKNICLCLQECISKSSIDSGQIRGVGFSAHGKGLYAIDKKGKPVRNGIISNDTRATYIVKDWIQKDIHKKAYPLGRQQIWTAHPVSLLAWLKKNEPENYHKIDTIFMAHDYIRYKLSGEKHAEITNISGSNAYNIQKNAYDEDMLALFGIKESIRFFPPTLSSFEKAGFISQTAANQTGLKAGTPIFGGFFDVVGGAISAGLTDEETLNIIAGTWAITTRIKKELIEDEYPYIWGSYSLKDTYFVHEGSPTSASNLQWFINHFMESEKNVFTICNRWVKELYEETSDIFFLPYLYGSNISLELSAAFYGLKAHHQKKHMIKAIYEAVVFSYLIHHERIIKLTPQIKKVRFTGGPTQSKIWMQLFCDAINLPLEVIELEQSGCSSAAFCAIVGTDKEKNIESLLQDFQPSISPYKPQLSQHNRLQKQYKKYKFLAYQMAEITKKLENI